MAVTPADPGSRDRATDDPETDARTDTGWGDRTPPPAPASAPTGERGRGRRAEGPGEIPKKGLRDVLLRVKDEMDRDNLSLAAAGVAFYALLALFPALAALVSIYGLVFDPASIASQLAEVGQIVPAEVLQIIDSQLTKVTATSDTALGFGFLVGVLLSIWSANKGMKAMVMGLNIVYDEREQRGFIKLNLISLGMTFGATLLVITALGVIVALPIVLDFVGLGVVADWTVLIVRWPLIAFAVIVGLGLLYRYGPDRRRPRWRWLTWGAVGATVVWAIASAGFSFYVANFDSYNETYGSMGAVIILLMWFYITAFIALLGAEVNSELEHQTETDSTVGPDRPMGERGAYVADHVGPVP